MENFSKSKGESAVNEIPVNEPSDSRDPAEDFKAEETEHLLNQHKKLEAEIPIDSYHSVSVSSDNPTDKASSMKAADDESMELLSEIDPSQNAPIPEDPMIRADSETKGESTCDPSATIDPEDPTETLGTATSEKTRTKRKTYLILGSIVGVLAITLVGFLIVLQMQASQVNKALALGESYLEEGKYEEAILAFDKVLDIDEKVVAAYEGKGASYLGLDDYVQAEEQLETAKTIEFSDNGKILMADVYVNTERKEDGLKLVEEVMASNPEDTKTVIRLGDFYAQIAEYNKVIEILEKRIALTEDPAELKKLYDELIPAYAKAGKTEAEILALLERAAKATGDETYLAKKDTYLVKKPSFNLAPGEYTGAQNLEVVKGNPNDKLYYTIDGTTPTVASPEYTGPLPLAVGEATVKIIEVNASGIASLPVEGKFLIKKAGLTDSEFLDALYGGWYQANTSTVMSFGYNQIGIGKAYTDSGYYGTYVVESTTENGGRIIVTGRMLDKNGTEYQVPIDFDFGVPGDNCVEVSRNGGEWITMTLGTSLGNNQYSVPSSIEKNGLIIKPT